MALTSKQRRFVEEYLIDLNAAQAAIRAGYSAKTAYSIGQENLHKPAIRTQIDERMAELSKRTGVNQERIIRELARIAFSNPLDLVDTVKAAEAQDAVVDSMTAIASVKVKSNPTERGEGIAREIRLADKIKALELLGKRFGMWVERRQIDGSTGVQIVDDLGDGTKEEIERRGGGSCCE